MVGKGTEGSILLSFEGAEKILGFALDHSFLTYKKELEAYGYLVPQISMKDKTILFKKKV